MAQTPVLHFARNAPLTRNLFKRPQSHSDAVAESCRSLENIYNIQRLVCAHAHAKRSHSGIRFVPLKNTTDTFTHTRTLPTKSNSVPGADGEFCLNFNDRVHILSAVQYQRYTLLYAVAVHSVSLEFKLASLGIVCASFSGPPAGCPYPSRHPLVLIGMHVAS